MKLSVIIPTNLLSEQTICTVNSIKFDDINYEILVVVDAKAKVELDIVRSLEMKNSVRVLFSDHQAGISGTLNYGLKNSRGELIMRLDDGDINLRQNIEKEVALLDHFDLVCAGMAVRRNDTKQKKIVKPKILLRSGHLSPFSRVPHPTWLFKKSKITVLYKTIDHRCEDFGFLVRNSLRIGYVDKVVVEYDISNKLNYQSEIRSALHKWLICLRSYRAHWIMVECSLYLIIRILRLTITLKKVI